MKIICHRPKSRWHSPTFTIRGISREDLSLILSFATDAINARLDGPEPYIDTLALIEEIEQYINADEEGQTQPLEPLPGSEQTVKHVYPFEPCFFGAGSRGFEGLCRYCGQVAQYMTVQKVGSRKQVTSLCQEHATRIGGKGELVWHTGELLSSKCE